MHKLSLIVLAAGFISMSGFAAEVPQQSKQKAPSAQQSQQQGSSTQQGTSTQQSQQQGAGSQQSGNEQGAANESEQIFDNSVPCSDWIGVNNDFFWRCMSQNGGN